MKNSLYYTPEIKEFYIGFDYEIKIKDNWRKMSTSISDFHSTSDYDGTSYLEEYLTDSIIRVKFLDKSDIESLGWLDGELRGMTPFIFNEMDPDNEFQLYYQFDNQFAQIYNCHAQFVFQGTIKNKSELIKLMNQLNINNNVKEF
jgi:hypothetical protein